MNAVKTLTIKEAEQLVNSDSGKKDGIHIRGITNLYEDAASVLAKYPGRLFFDDLTRLSESAASELLAHRGGLSLKSLRNISDELADILVQYQGDLKLDIDVAKLKKINVSLLKLIIDSTQQLDFLDFESLEFLEWEAAKILADFNGELIMNNIRELSNSTAIILSFHKGAIHLNGIRNLSHLEASALSNHCGDLFLNGIVEIDERVAAALVNHCGFVEIKNVKSLSIEVAMILAAYGDNLIMQVNELYPIDVFEVLSCKKSIRPFSLENFQFKRLTPKSAELLINTPKPFDRLDLTKLSSLSASTASILSEHRGDLILSGLDSITVDVAKSLSNHRGLLNLDGLVKIIDDVAEALSRHEGQLSLNGLTELSERFADLFSHHKGILIIENVIWISDDSALALSNRDNQFPIIGLDFIQKKNVFTPGYARLCARLGRQNSLCSINEEIAEELFSNWNSSEMEYISLRGLQCLKKEIALVICKYSNIVSTIVVNYIEEQVLRIFLESGMTIVCLPSTPSEAKLIIEMYENNEIKKEETEWHVRQNKKHIKDYSRTERAYLSYMVDSNC